VIYVAAVIGAFMICVVIAPFWVGPGGLLAAGAQVNSPERLGALKAALLKRYLADEEAYKAGTLSRLSWDKRKAFLANRYIDTSRRLDYLEQMARLAAGGER